MDRRDFLQTGSLAAIGGLIVPNTLLAKPSDNIINSSTMAGGVFYTKQAPGRWEKKAGSHSPVIEKTPSGVRVITGHPMQVNKHWIVKHMLLDQDFKFITEKIFDPHTDTTAMSNFTLSGQTGAVYALSVCNLHDTWLSKLEI